MQNPKRILFTGGGSGGHIMPNLAIVSELKKLNPSAQILYIGSRRLLDRKLVSHLNIPFRGIFSGKLRRYFSWQNFADPLLILIGFLQALWAVARFWPQVVFTKGGYVAMPVVLAAWIFRRPIILQESDAVMGLANRLTARLAKKVCLGFPGVFPLSDKVILTGNPVRAEITRGSKDRGYTLTGLTPELPVLLAWGGSQGAQEINDLIQKHFDQIKSHVQVVHVTGQGKAIGIQDPHYRAYEYIGNELADIYAITNIVFGRSGANSLYELALVGKPNILLPLRGSAHNHQQMNADYFEKRGASLILRDKSSFADTIIGLLKSSEKQTSMKKALSAVSRPSAAKVIARLILDL